MTSADIRTRSDRYLFPVYARARLALVRGEGTRVWDADGREYLDGNSSLWCNVHGHRVSRIGCLFSRDTNTEVRTVG